MASAIEAQLPPAPRSALLASLGLCGWLDRLTPQPSAADLVREPSGDAVEAASLSGALESFTGRRVGSGRDGTLRRRQSWPVI